MTETERAAWAAFEAGIVEDAVAAGLINCVEDVVRLNRQYAGRDEAMRVHYIARALAVMLAPPKGSKRD